TVKTANQVRRTAAARFESAKAVVRSFVGRAPIFDRARWMPRAGSPRFSPAAGRDSSASWLEAPAWRGRGSVQPDRAPLRPVIQRNANLPPALANDLKWRLCVNDNSGEVLLWPSGSPVQRRMKGIVAKARGLIDAAA